MKPQAVTSRSQPVREPEAARFFMPLDSVLEDARPEPSRAEVQRNELVTCPQVLLGVLSDSECDAAEKYARAARRDDGGMIVNREGYRSVSSDWVLPADDSLWLYRKVARFGRQVARWYGFEVVGFFEPLLFVRYIPGDGFEWHVDCGTEGTCTRKLSISLQLSAEAEYRGGGLEFHPQGELPGSRARGAAIVFPSFVSHRVARVEEGARSAIVAWLHGPTFR